MFLFSIDSDMGTELIRVCVEEDNDDFPSVPPGFESYISFSLGKVHNHEKQDSHVPISLPTSISESQPVKVETEVEVADVAKVTRSLRRKPCINYRQYDYCSDDELGTKRPDQVGFWLFSFIIVIVLPCIMV